VNPWRFERQIEASLLSGHNEAIRIFFTQE
jgi:hypothetical protein